MFCTASRQITHPYANYFTNQIRGKNFDRRSGKLCSVLQFLNLVGSAHYRQIKHSTRL